MQLRHLYGALAGLLPFVQLVAGQEYDYVVVGSGPGGGPLAVDLAKAGHTVLLLEAGSDLTGDAVYADVARAAEATNDARSRWDFFVRHSDDAARERAYAHLVWRAANGSFHVGPDPPPPGPPDAAAEPLGIWYPRAATLGGGAMHGAGVLALPGDGVWDGIAAATGDASWAAGRMRAVFRDIENCRYREKGTGGHGFGGWLDTNRAPGAWVGNASDGRAVLEAVVAELSSQAGGARNNMSTAQLAALLDRDVLTDAPATAPGVFGLVTHTDADGRRASPGQYIRRALAEDPSLPLTVSLDAFVTNITWDTLGPSLPPAVMGVNWVTGRGAYGADPRRHRAAAARNLSSHFAYVSQELIVAGGAFNTPQLLKLSGVGPAAELARHHIPLVADVPGVGANLGDNVEGSTVALAAHALGSLGDGYSVQLQTSSAAAAAQEGRDIFMRPLPGAFEGFWPGYPAAAPPTAFSMAYTHRGRSSSRSAGTVTLRSSNPFEPPDINLRLFGDNDTDGLGSLAGAAAFVEASKARMVGPLAPLGELHPCPSRGHAGGKQKQKNCSAAEVRETLRLQAYSRHASGTCAMGDLDADPLAVVDGRFRVRGVRRLRVVDASVFPRPPGPFPILPTFMISRKAVRAILEDYDGWP
ncbi:GMC oxidoreductase [Xylariomycetidae sp. FL0641]|nr:GMC oxidoreductase [Xylariomycetidae sp. FL0641]